MRPRGDADVAPLCSAPGALGRSRYRLANGAERSRATRAPVTRLGHCPGHDAAPRWRQAHRPISPRKEAIMTEEQITELVIRRYTRVQNPWALWQMNLYVQWK